MRPLHGYAEPVIARSPPSGTHKHVVATVRKKLPVDAFHIVGDSRIVHGSEIIVCLDIHNVHHVLAYAVSQRVGRAQQASVVRYAGKVFVEHLLGVDDGPYLQKIELARAVVVDVARELDLHRTLHALRTILHRHLQKLRQREHTLLKHTAERYYLTSAVVYTVAYHLVVRVVGRRYEAERLVFVSLLHLQFQNIETVVHLEVVAHMRGVESVELGLCLAQRRLHLARLQHLIGMIGRHAQRLSAVHDVFSESQRERGNSVLSLLVAYGIVVERAQHTAEVGIITVVVLLANHLLKYHSHLFLVDDIARGGHVSLRVTVIHGRIDTLDGACQHLEHGILVLHIRYHVRGINACEGLVVCVLEERARPYCDGTLHRIEEYKEVVDERFRQFRT